MTNPHVETIERKYMKGQHKAVRPRDAATIILIDRRGREPRVLMGLRNEAAKFMPGVFVFPGGRVEIEDGLVPHAGALSARDVEALHKMSGRLSERRIRAFALAAIRETFEETGLRIGVPGGAALERPGAWRKGTWAEFTETGLMPTIDDLHFLSRAITPPGRNRRFDTRFFVRDVSALAEQVVDRTTPDSELVELKWVPFAETSDLKTVEITKIMLEELQRQAEQEFAPSLPRPMYRALNGKFQRIQL
ncbi:MAG TPA: NUDIX hydrolase [Beijerinckiaceae bacterium]|nr:NUDIX hydrolase [Beijerinckiaceae bacterium]